MMWDTHVINHQKVKKILILLITISLFWSCESRDIQKVNDDLIKPSIENLSSLQMLPTLPAENIQGLMDNADYIDYIFYNYGKSINQGDKSSVQNMIRQITNTPQPDINCAMPFCKIIFYKMPDKLLEGEIHFGNGCAYFVFPDGNRQAQYVSKMGNSGILFFNDLISNFSAPAGE